MARKSRARLTDEQTDRLIKIAERDQRREETWARLKTWGSAQIARLKIWITALVFGAGGITTLYDFYRLVLSNIGGGAGGH
jgi:hypothetical protein